MKRQKTLIKIGIMMIFALLISIFAGIAWFTMNQEVGTGGMSIKTVASQFELAVPSRSGAETYYNTNINELGYLTGDDQLSTRSGSIRCVLRDESPSISSGEYKGIHPGSYGSLTFYIVPGTAVADSYNVSLDMRGYYAEFVLDANGEPTKQIVNNTFQELSEKAGGDSSSIYLRAADYMKGHIMFFENHRVLTAAELNGTTDAGLYYSDRISGAYTYVTTDHTPTTWNGQTAYEVKLYWIWPNTFGQIILDKESENLYGEAMFSSKQSGTTSPRADLIDYIANNPEYYFSSADLLGKNPSELTTMMGTTALSTTNSLLTLSNGYKEAEQLNDKRYRIRVFRKEGRL